MLTRIVKMEFQSSETEAFLQHFDTIKEKIRAFPGCTFLQLYRDQNDPTIFFTYSQWEAPSDLETYRKSELFKGVWATTKPKFRSKAQAWSVDTLHTVTP
ncbi:MAG: antibiotic biosynthesis monooxygenase [Flavobacteriaceae bacterium]|nr:antibiotic biosynthesis monooxygenase [Flavobacteriaceae bacterium]|tara:strand:+ start:7948 stop:8247 length:300 start_codon:yes stop_codon:yes gene_type:complete